MHTLTLLMQIILCCFSSKMTPAFPVRTKELGCLWEEGAGMWDAFCQAGRERGGWMLAGCSKTGLARCWCRQENLFVAVTKYKSHRAVLCAGSQFNSAITCRKWGCALSMC